VLKIYFEAFNNRIDFLHYFSIPEVKFRDSLIWKPVSKHETKTAQLNLLQLDLQPTIAINAFSERMRFWDAIYQNKA